MPCLLPIPGKARKRQPGTKGSGLDTLPPPLVQGTEGPACWEQVLPVRVAGAGVLGFHLSWAGARATPEHPSPPGLWTPQAPPVSVGAGIKAQTERAAQASGRRGPEIMPLHPTPVPPRVLWAHARVPPTEHGTPALCQVSQGPRQAEASSAPTGYRWSRTRLCLSTGDGVCHCRAPGPPV